MWIAELPDQIGARTSKPSSSLLSSIHGTGKRVYSIALATRRVETFCLSEAFHHIKLRPIDVIRQQRCVRGAARKFGFVAISVDDTALGAVTLKKAADVTNIVQQTCDEDMRKIGWTRRSLAMRAPSLFVADKGHQHRMFDVVIERVAVADTFKSQPGDQRDEFGCPGLCRPKPAAEVFGKVVTEGLSCQFRNRDHGLPP